MALEGKLKRLTSSAVPNHFHTPMNDDAPDDRPPVELPQDGGDIEGRRVSFVPVRHGVIGTVEGLLHVFSSGEACHVGAVYTPDDGEKPTVYWFDQAEFDAVLGQE